MSSFAKFLRSETALFWVLRFVMIFLLPAFISDLEKYLYDASLVLDSHLVPYRDFPYEYPPLAYYLILAAVRIARALSLTGEVGLRICWSIFILPLDYLLFRAFQKKPPIPRAAFLYTYLTFLLAPLLYDRLDLLVAFAIAAPFLFSKQQSSYLYSFFWGFGSALKLVPGMFIPFLLIRARGAVSKIHLCKILLWALAPLMASILFVWLISGRVSFLTYHQLRGLQVESMPASVLLLFRKMQWIDLKIETAYGAQQIAGYTGITTAWKVIFFAQLLVSFFALAWRSYRRTIQLESAVWLLLLSFITFNYVLSTQYVLWLIPMGLIAAQNLAEKGRTRFVGILYAMVIATSAHFLFFWYLAQLRWPSVLLLLTRNALLMALLAVSWIGLGTHKEKLVR
jgi:hypothetical protein